jgi:hypothetical protein
MTGFVDEEERWNRVIELERLERNLAFAQQCAKECKPEVRELWEVQVQSSERDLQFFKSNRTKQLKLETTQ